jgi:thiamine biosynthesis lipoprotein
VSAGTLRVEAVMGTVFRIEVCGAPVSDAVLDEAVALLHRHDEVFSTYREDSPVSRLSRGEVALTDCPAEVAAVAALCADAYQATGGYFTPGYAGGYDPTGLVKGWSVERVHDLLRCAGSTAHSVNGGGDVRVFGETAPGEPWQVGITHPLAPDSFVAVVSATDLAVATSGSYERGPHVLNPFTGRPARELASVTVTGPDLAFADAYATALLAMGDDALDWATRQPRIEALIVCADGTLRRTPGFGGPDGGGGR